MLGAIQPLVLRPVEQQHAITRAAAIARHWEEQDPSSRRQLLQTFVQRIQVHLDRIEIQLHRQGLVELLLDRRPGNPATDAARLVLQDAPIILTVSAALKRTGMEMRLVVSGAASNREPDPGLMRLLARAHLLQRHLVHDPSVTVDEIGRREGLSKSYVTRVLRLNFLAPEIVTRILDGSQPPELTAARLMHDTRLPVLWTEQKTGLGFA